MTGRRAPPAAGGMNAAGGTNVAPTNAAAMMVVFAG